jgi:ABC-type sulfate transport system substrate-binding protein
MVAHVRVRSTKRTNRSVRDAALSMSYAHHTQRMLSAFVVRAGDAKLMSK